MFLSLSFVFLVFLSMTSSVIFIFFPLSILSIKLNVVLYMLYSLSPAPKEEADVPATSPEPTTTKVELKAEEAQQTGAVSPDTEPVKESPVHR
jgi:hypothetical protein